MNASTMLASVLAFIPAEATVVSPFWWEIVKGVLLFAITGFAGFIARGFLNLNKLVVNHEEAIYGRDGQNGLKRGLKDVTDRIDLIEDRNTAIDAVAEAERAQHHGPERRHAALHQIVEMVAAELKKEKHNE